MKNTDIDGGAFCKKCAGKCCSSCASRFGYYRDNYHSKALALSEEAKRIIKDLDEKISMTMEEGIELAKKLAKELGATFTKEKGFLGPNGCTIPRHLRSKTCTGFSCYDLDKYLKDQKRKLHKKV